MKKAMTKTEFILAAQKAGINPNIYGLVIDSPISVKSETFIEPNLCDGKVIGIEWFEEWKTEREYSPARGYYDETFLSKAPYVVLKKGKSIYYASADTISIYLHRLLNDCIISKVKAQKEQKKG